MKDSKNDNQINNYWYLALLAFLLLTLDSSNKLWNFKNNISEIFQPLYYNAVNIDNRWNNFLGKFSYLGSENEIIDSQKRRISLLEGQLADHKLLEEKYNTLLTQSKFVDKKYQYIKTELYIPNDGSNVVINVGTNDGIRVGDIVLSENVYIGRVDKVDSESSRVLSVFDENSVLEVVIQSGSGKRAPVKAVAVGRNNEILIENIPGNSGIENDDLVLVNDKSTNGYLVIGKIKNIVNDKAASLVSAKVTMGIDLQVTKFVYVRK